MSFTNQAETIVLNQIFRGTATGYSASWALALFYSASSSGTNPGDDTSDGVVPQSSASHTEVSGGSYARTSPSGSPDFNAASGNTIQNNGAISFPQATANWAASPNFVNGWGLYDVTGNECVFTGAFSAGKEVLTLDTVSVADTALSITLD